MPIITVALYSGRSQREKDRLAEAITDDTVKILKVERNDIIVLFEESPHGHSAAPIPAPAQPLPVPSLLTCQIA